jgi:hypothetical protein
MNMWVLTLARLASMEEIESLISEVIRIREQ